MNVKLNIKTPGRSSLRPIHFDVLTGFAKAWDKHVAEHPGPCVWGKEFPEVTCDELRAFTRTTWTDQELEAAIRFLQATSLTWDVDVIRAELGGFALQVRRWEHEAEGVWWEIVKKPNLLLGGDDR